MKSTTSVFTVKRVNGLRDRLEKAFRIEEGTVPPNGWSTSSVDPMCALALFRPLRLRPGFVLRAYQFYENGNGNGVVYALPVDGGLPEPWECTKIRARRPLIIPVPPSALDDVMQVIDGDGTPWSYMSASILSREIEEFGAMWHGCDWSTHRIVDQVPRLKKAGPWKWTQHPVEWRPTVVQSATRTRVTFHTYSGHHGQRIERNVDVYPRGGYTASTKTNVMATAGGGYIF